MHSLFERISYLLSDLCHFIAALNGKRISVGFHIIEEHEGLVQKFILERRFSSSSIPAIAFITSSMVAML